MLICLRVSERPQPAQEGPAQDSAEGQSDGEVQEGEEQGAPVWAKHIVKKIFMNKLYNGEYQVSTLLNKIISIMAI